MYMDAIGVERYGVLSIIWLLLGYFGFFDLGIGRATAHRIALNERKKQNPDSEIIWTSLLSSCVLAIVGAIPLYLVGGYALENWVQMGAVLRSEVSEAMLWVAISLVLMILSGTLNGALVGKRKFLSVNVMDVSTKVLLQVLPLGIALCYASDLGSLAVAVFVARVLSFFGWLYICNRNIPFLINPGGDFVLVKKLLNYGGWITLGSLVAPLLSGAERFFIGSYEGADSITLYAVSFSLIAPVALVSGSLSASLFPLFSSQEKEVSTKLTHKAIDAVIVLVTPLMVGLTFVVQPFMSVWMSPEFADKSFGISQILVVGFWANSMGKIFHSKLQGEGHPNTVALVHLFELLPYFLLLMLLTENFGVLGATLAWTVRTVLDMFLLGIKSKAWNWRSPLFIAAFTMIVTASVCSYILPSTVSFLVGGGFVLLSLLWAWRNGLDSYLNLLVPTGIFK
jgi:O-antigen/teichoic acid export membrane protein